MTQTQQIKAEIERRRTEFINKAGQTNLHDAEIIRRAVISNCNDILTFIESLEKEHHKTNPFFEECVAKVDTATMKEVSDNVDKILEKEQPQGLDEAALEKAKYKYIRKDDLLEWAKDTYLCENASAIRTVCFKQLVDKLNSM